MLAGAVVDRLSQDDLVDRIDDSARIARCVWNRCVWKQPQSPTKTLGVTLRESLGGRNLAAIGYQADIDRCAQLNTIDGIVERIRPGEAVFEYRADRAAAT